MAEALITAVNSAYEDSISSNSTPSHSDKHANLEKHEKLIKVKVTDTINIIFDNRIVSAR
jgi:hypothetical protein